MFNFVTLGKNKPIHSSVPSAGGGYGRTDGHMYVHTDEMHLHMCRDEKASPLWSRCPKRGVRKRGGGVRVTRGSEGGEEGDGEGVRTGEGEASWGYPLSC